MEKPGPCFITALLFLDCSSFVSAFPYFPDEQLFKPALWYSGKVEEFEAFSPTIEVRDMERICSQEASQGPAWFQGDVWLLEK